MKNRLHEPADLSIAAMRSLVIDTINKANSGHPGMALDVAPAMYALFHDHLVADPKDPIWVNRDRFVLSSGHVSSLLYTTLHLCGFDVTMEDMKQFRQLGSRTPGHPELGETAGVDCTSGPLGQGIGTAVGMAMAEAHLRAQYPDSGFGHYTYAVCGDGCLQEGISQEAISLAGHLHLNRLILIYDANGATLDGPLSDSFSENVELRFLASEWNVIKVEDGNSYAAVSKAIAKAKKSKDPTLIMIHTRIGFGSVNEGSSKTHGAPLGEEDGAHCKEVYGWEYPPFEIPEEVYEDFRASFASRGAKAHEEYNQAQKAYRAAHPEEAKRYEDGFAHDYSSYVPSYPEFKVGESVATRASSGKCLAAFHDGVPFTFGGSADVAGSTKTDIKGETAFSFLNPIGRDIRYGIREFGMAAAMNGMALHGGVLPYGAIFCVFADYMKPALRLAALQRLPVFYLLSHDTIAVGEDGPTHQPIDQLPMLRSIPGFEVIRPADAKEMIGAYEIVRGKKEGPTAILLTRQGVETLEATDPAKTARGGYLVYEPKKADYLILATGSEVPASVHIAKKLEERGIYIAVASLPSVSRFLAQDQAYIDSVLFLPREKRISIEMASTFGWGGLAAHNLGIDTFGASGPAKDVIAHFGFDEASLAQRVEEIVRKG